MAAGGRRGGPKASKTAKSNAGKKGFEALIAKTVAETLKAAAAPAEEALTAKLATK